MKTMLLCIMQAVWWTGHLFKSHTGTHTDLQGSVWWRGRLRREEIEQNSQDKGRGEGRYTSARWHRLLCNWAPKLFIHRPPCPPFSSPSSTAADQVWQSGEWEFVCTGVRLTGGFWYFVQEFHFGFPHFLPLLLEVKTINNNNNNIISKRKKWILTN